MAQSPTGQLASPRREGVGRVHQRLQFRSAAEAWNTTQLVLSSLQPPSPGTYNNQYMVLDLNRVEPLKDIHDNALWVVEQIPG